MRRKDGPLEQASELVGVPLRVNRRARLVCDHVLTALVPVEHGQRGLVRRARLCAFLDLQLAQRGQCGDQLVV